MYVDVTDQPHHQMGISEAIAMPVIPALMTLVFSSLVAAGLPLVLGVLSIGGFAQVFLHRLAAVTPVSNYALNVTTIVGARGSPRSTTASSALTRFREERTRSPAPMMLS